MVKGISAATALAELPKNATVWIVAQGDGSGVVMVPNNPTGEPLLLMFLKKEDATHLALLLSKEAPGLKRTRLDIVEIGFHDILERAMEENQLIGLLGPNEAMKFFKEFDQWLPNYYK
jgi:hypothetical protein